MRNASSSGLRLLHCWWPLALGWSLTVVVHRSTGRSADPYGLAALLSGIAAAYSLDRALDPPDREAPTWLTPLLGAVGVGATVVCAGAAWNLPVRSAALVPLLGASSVAYPFLKRLWLTKTLVLPLAWVWASIALPFGDGSWLGWRAVLQPVAAPLLLLIGAGCLLCDLKDESDDRQAGVRSVPSMLGGVVTIRIAVALALSAGALAVAEHRPGIVISAAALGLAATWPAVLATDAAGPLLVDVILSLPGILISARVL